MALTKENVTHIAHLARLAVSEEEAADYVAKLTSILGLVDELRKVDTTGVSPMAHPLAMAQRLRPDVVLETDRRDEFQQNAPQAAEGLYLVPRVLE